MEQPFVKDIDAAEPLLTDTKINKYSHGAECTVPAAVTDDLPSLRDNYVSQLAYAPLLFQESRRSSAPMSLEQGGTVDEADTFPYHRSLIPSRGSIRGSVFNLSSATLGAGALSLPYAVAVSGLAFTLCQLIIAAILTIYTIRLLIHAGKLTKLNSYEDLALYCFGRKFAIFVELNILTFCFGIAVAYLVTLGDILMPLGELYFGSDTYFAHRWVLMSFACVLVMLPLSLLRDISSLQFSSIMGVLSITFLVLAVCIRSIMLISKSGIPPGTVWSLNTTHGLDFVLSIPIVMFAFTNQVNVFSIYTELQRPSIRRMNKVVVSATAVAFFLYATIGVIAYLAFGPSLLDSKSKGNILLSFPLDDPLIAVARAALTLTVSVAFPLNIFPCRFTIDMMFFANAKESKFRHITVTSILVFLALVLAIFCPGINVIFGIIGGTCSTIVCFCLPAAFIIKLEKGLIISRAKIPVLLLLVGAVVIGMTSTIIVKPSFLFAKYLLVSYIMKLFDDEQTNDEYHTEITAQDEGANDISPPNDDTKGSIEGNYEISAFSDADTLNPADTFFANYQSGCREGETDDAMNSYTEAKMSESFEVEPSFSGQRIDTKPSEESEMAASILFGSSDTVNDLFATMPNENASSRALFASSNAQADINDPFQEIIEEDMRSSKEVSPHTVPTSTMAQDLSSSPPRNYVNDVKNETLSTTPFEYCAASQQGLVETEQQKSQLESPLSFTDRVGECVPPRPAAPFLGYSDVSRARSFRNMTNASTDSQEKIRSKHMASEIKPLRRVEENARNEQIALFTPKEIMIATKSVDELVQEFMSTSITESLLILNTDMHAANNMTHEIKDKQKLSDIPDSCDALEVLYQCNKWQTLAQKAQSMMNNEAKDTCKSLEITSWRIASMIKGGHYDEASIELDKFGDWNHVLKVCIAEGPKQATKCASSFLPMRLFLLDAILCKFRKDKTEWEKSLFRLIAIINDAIQAKRTVKQLGVQEDKASVWLRIAQFALINHLVQEQKFALALRVLSTLGIESLKTIHQQVVLLSRVGRIYLQVGDLASAKLVFEQAQLLSLTWMDGALCSKQAIEAQIQLNTGLFLLASDKYHESLDVFDSILHIHLLMQCGQHTQTLNLVQASVEDVENAFCEEDLICAAVNNYAICALYCCDVHKAVLILENIIRVNPTRFLNDVVIFNLSSLYDLVYDNDNSTKRKEMLKKVAEMNNLEHIDTAAFRI